MKLQALLSLIFLVCASNLSLFAQVEEGNVYTFQQLSTEAPQITATLMPTDNKFSSDTVYTIYTGDGSTVDFKTFFVEGQEYDNIFNPNPTGMIINGKEFLFYCNLEKSIRQNFNNILEMYEFTLNGVRDGDKLKKFLMLISFRENCLGDGCDYRCYNVFDITNPDRIKQVAFSSVFQGIDTFGDFDGNAGSLEFLRGAPKPHEGFKKGDIVEHFLVTAYSIRSSSAQQLKNPNTKHPYYMYVKDMMPSGEGEPKINSFQVMKADWFFSLKDSTGNVAESSSFFAEYISFDPLYQHLYNPDGVRIQKNRWSVHINDLGDLEAAQEYCRRIQQNFEEVYIMIDQYSGDISFQVYVGNFMSKDLAIDYQNRLKEVGIVGTLRDLRERY